MKLAANKVYVDSTLVITASEGAPELSEPLKAFFACFRRVPLAAVTSELTLAEVLGREAKAGWAWQTRFYLGLLVWSEFIELRPVTRSILEDTGSFRRSARLSGRKYKLPDAIHIVSPFRLDAACS